MEALSQKEGKSLIACFLKCRGKKGATESEIEKLLGHCATLKMDACLWRLLSEGKILPDLKDGEISFQVLKEM